MTNDFVCFIYEFPIRVTMTMNVEGTVKNSDDVVKEEVPDAKGIKIQWLISDKDGSDRIYLRKFTMEPGADMTLHSHPDTEHVQYYIKGKVKLFMSSDEYDVEAGDSVFIPAGVKHKYVNLSTEEAIFLCMIPGGDTVTNLEE